MIITIIQRKTLKSLLHSQYKEKVGILPQSPQAFLVLIWLISEKWKTESPWKQANIF